jgi:hypothetical protein
VLTLATLTAIVLAVTAVAVAAHTVGRAHGARPGPAPQSRGTDPQPAPVPEQTAAPTTTRVTVQLVTRDGRTWVEAVAQISDGHVTAHGTHEDALSYWDREYGDRTLTQDVVTQNATRSALRQATRLLAGAHAGYTAEATAHAARAADADRATANAGA